MNKTLNITKTAILFALAVILSYLESLIPMPSVLVGVKLGLSNIVTMYCLFFLGKKHAFILVFLKSLFAFLTRGTTAGILSLSGGVVSLLAMIILLLIFKEKISFILLSVIGGVLHNVGQLAVSCILTRNIFSLYYLPVLLISGTVAGIITGVILKIVLPALQRIKS